MAVAGYSGTPLAKKLGISEGTTVVAVDAPKNYRGLLEPLPAAVRFAPKIDKTTDIIDDVWSGLKLVARKELR